jgi:hypothetical protein
VRDDSEYTEGLEIQVLVSHSARPAPFREKNIVSHDADSVYKVRFLDESGVL